MPPTLTNDIRAQQARLARTKQSARKRLRHRDNRSVQQIITTPIGPATVAAPEANKNTSSVSETQPTPHQHCGKTGAMATTIHIGHSSLDKPSASSPAVSVHVEPAKSEHCHCACSAAKSTATASTDDKAAVKTEDKKDEAKKDDKKESDTASSAGVNTPTESEDGRAMKCEIKHLDRRYDDKDEVYFEERKSDNEEKPKQELWWEQYALCHVRVYDSDKELDATRLYINPQPLRQLLFDVIGDYPSDPIDVDDVQIDAPYHSLFHYRKELKETGYSRFESDEASKAQLDLLLDWINKHFEADIAAQERCLSGHLKAIAYDKLWTLLLPGKTIVHAKVQNQHRCFKVHDTWYDSSEIPGLGMSVNFIDFNGERLGTRRTELFVPKYTGTKALSELPCQPFEMIEDYEDVRKEMIARGKKFEEHMGQHFVQYEGVGLKKVPDGYAKVSVNGRIMIDAKTFARLQPNDTFGVRDLENDKSAKEERARRKAQSYMSDDAPGAEDEDDEVYVHDKLSDDDLCLCSPMVRGFAFKEKEFLDFFVDKVKPIQFNEKCWDELVLDGHVKKTLRALVSAHSRKKESGEVMEDIIKGKGAGLVSVLHGNPGVGKTLSAECVAEFVKRPLYMCSSGDLGVSARDLDHTLTRIMDMTTTWRAVLLIDEADVFLERRSLHDLHRNAMVSVLLKTLDYYSGIIFLTTNRVATFDEAFTSRIHLPIRYSDLSHDSKKQIWRHFVGRVPGACAITDKQIDKLAEKDLNGRQIKNILKTAESLASYDGVKLDYDYIQQVTKIQATFEKDLTSHHGVDYTAEGGVAKDADARNFYM